MHAIHRNRTPFGSTGFLCRRQPDPLRPAVERNRHFDVSRTRNALLIPTSGTNDPRIVNYKGSIPHVYSVDVATGVVKALASKSTFGLTDAQP